MRCRVLFTILMASAAGALAAGAQSPKSPFLPANNAGPAVASANEVIEFAGVSQMGNTTHLIFLDKTTKKNRWVGIGETVEGISVLKYDPRLEQVVVKINGAEKTLALRKGTGPVNAPGQPVAALPPAAGFAVASPAPLPTVPQLAPAPFSTPGNTDPTSQGAMQPQPVKPPGPATPEGQVKAETEARMLVSDLLEIGMAQRKAYEEAQRRAAEGKPPQQPATEQPPAAQPVK